MGIAVWAVAVGLGAAASVGHAFYLKKQFYPAVVYLTQSQISMFVSVRKACDR